MKHLIIPAGLGVAAILFFLSSDDHSLQQSAASAIHPIEIHSEEQQEIVQLSHASQTKAPKVTKKIEPSIEQRPEDSIEPALAYPENPIDRIRAIQEKTALHESILSDHQRFSRYPSFNSRFEKAENDPIAKRYEQDFRTSRADDSDLSLTIWTDQKFYLADDQVTIFAMLQDDQEQRQPGIFAAQLIYNERESLFPLEFNDDDGDGIYESRFIFSDAEQSQRPGVYKVLIVNNQNELSDSAAFILSEPEASFTGNYRDRVDESGNLIIEAELAVTKSNRYSVEASLYSSTNDPIGQTQNAVNLDVGTHWLPMTFYGLMFHDAGEPGPYHLKHVSLAKVAMPIQRAPITTTAFYTNGYTIDEFSRAPYVN